MQRKSAFSEETSVMSMNVMRAKAAAKYLGGIGVSTFHRWVAEGRLPKGRKLSPRCVVWSRAVLDAFLAGGEDNGKEVKAA